MNQISTAEMETMLDGTKGATMVGLIAITDPYGGKPLKKKRNSDDPNPFLTNLVPEGHALVKVQRGHAMFNCRYNRAVEKRVATRINDERATEGLPPLEGEELRVAIDERFRKGDNWQEAVVRSDGTMTPFARHKTNGTVYLRTMFFKAVGEPVYIDIRDGRMFSEREIGDCLPAKSENKNQGLPKEEQVRYNVWKLLGIRALKLGGEMFRVKPPLEREAEEVFEALNARLAEMEPPEPPAMDDASN